MSKKILQKAWQLGKNIGTTVSKKGRALANRQSLNSIRKNINNINVWEHFRSKLQEVAAPLEPFKKYANSPYYSTLNFMSKDSKGDAYNKQGKSQSGGSGDKKESYFDKKQGANFSFMNDHIESLKNSAAKKYSELGATVQSQAQNITKKSKQTLQKTAEELKSSASAQLNSLKQSKKEILSSVQSKIKQKKEQSAEYVKSKLNEVKEEKISLLKEKAKESEQFLNSQKQKIVELGKEGAEKLSESSQKLTGAAKEKISEAAFSKKQLVNKLLKKLFWRLLIVIGVVSFAYGLGTTIPKELFRIARQSMKEGNKKQTKHSPQ